MAPLRSADRWPHLVVLVLALIVVSTLVLLIFLQPLILIVLVLFVGPPLVLLPSRRGSIYFRLAFVAVPSWPLLDLSPRRLLVASAPDPEHLSSLCLLSDYIPLATIIIYILPTVFIGVIALLVLLRLLSVVVIVIAVIVVVAMLAPRGALPYGPPLSHIHGVALGFGRPLAALLLRFVEELTQVEQAEYVITA